MLLILGRRYSKSIAEEGGMNTGPTWIGDDKRRQHYSALQLHLLGGKGRYARGRAGVNESEAMDD